MTIPITGALVEWLAILPPYGTSGLTFEKGRDFFEAGARAQLDNTPLRIALVGWNYGPSSVNVFMHSTGETLCALVPPGSPIYVPGISDELDIEVPSHS